MPRPKTVDDTAVLDAAMRVVDRAGPGGLTLGAVAGEVGLSPATLVQRFTSKRGLLLALARRGAGGAAPVMGLRRTRSPGCAPVGGVAPASPGLRCAPPGPGLRCAAPGALLIHPQGVARRGPVAA